MLNFLQSCIPYYCRLPGSRWWFWAGWRLLLEGWWMNQTVWVAYCPTVIWLTLLISAARNLHTERRTCHTERASRLLFASSKQKLQISIWISAPFRIVRPMLLKLKLQKDVAPYYFHHFAAHFQWFLVVHAKRAWIIDNIHSWLN